MVGRVDSGLVGLSARSLALEARGVRAGPDQATGPGPQAGGAHSGRDTDPLAREIVVQATVETIAENTTDGVIAP